MDEQLKKYRNKLLIKSIVSPILFIVFIRVLGNIAYGIGGLDIGYYGTIVGVILLILLPVLALLYVNKKSKDPDFVQKLQK